MTGATWYFSSYRQGTLALWRVALAGGSPVRLTGGSGPERRPSISRDGARLAYTTFVDDPDVIVRDLSRGVEHRIAGLRDEHAPTMAPDGSAVALRSGPVWRAVSSVGAIAVCRRSHRRAGAADGPCRICRAAILLSRREVDCLPPRCRKPARHLDRARVRWCRPEVYRRSGDRHSSGVVPRRLQIVFDSEREGGSHLWVGAVKDGRSVGPARRLTSGPTVDESPSWSPHGTWIAYISHRRWAAPTCG